jgi:hypothetical protein
MKGDLPISLLAAGLVDVLDSSVKLRKTPCTQHRLSTLRTCLPRQAASLAKVDRYLKTSFKKRLGRWTSLQPQGRSALFPVFTTITVCCLLACLGVMLTSFRPIRPWLWRCVRRLKTSRACSRPSVRGRQKRSFIVVFWYIVQDASRGFALPSTQLTSRL